MASFINSFNSISRKELDDVKRSEVLPSVFDLRIDNIFEVFQAVTDGFADWTIDRQSGVKAGDICLFMCSATASKNIRMLRSFLKSKIDEEGEAYLDELCDKYDRYAGMIVSIGIVDDIPDTPERLEYASFKNIIGLELPIPYNAFKSIVAVSSFGSMTKIADEECKQLFAIIKFHNPNMDFSLLGMDNPKDTSSNRTQKEALLLETKNLENEINTLNLTGKERQALVSVRVNQGEYRKQLLSRYSNCCLGGVSDARLLVASHIKPWVDSNEYEKVDVYNGLLLCPNHDKLFDNGFITFDEDKKIIISNQLSENDRRNMHITSDMKVDCDDCCMTYMKYHREKVFEKKI